jgi:uncharacterized Zn-finger protein
MPSQFSWSGVREHGLLGVFSAPADTTTTAGGRVVKVDAVVTPKVVTVPFGEPVPDKPGYVFSPFTEPRKMVDVRDFKSGEEVRCPYTFKPFLVPDAEAFLAENRASRSSAPVLGPKRTDVVSSDLSIVPSHREEDFTPTPPAPSAPTPAPKVNKNGAPSTPEPAHSEDPAKKTFSDLAQELPYGRRVPGRPGFVYSPYASQYQLVDVAGMAPGIEVKCPYTGKLFRIPEAQADESSAPKAPAPAPAEQPSAPKVEEKPKPPAADNGSPPPALPKANNDKPGGAAPDAAKPKEPAKNEQPKPAAAPQPKKDDSLPVAKWAQKEKGLVQSPFGQPGQLVDVTNKAPGSKMDCPFTGKAFLIPAE